MATCCMSPIPRTTSCARPTSRAGRCGQSPASDVRRVGARVAARRSRRRSIRRGIWSSSVGCSSSRWRARIRSGFSISMRSLAIPYAGSGREARVDGSIDDAAFAQPSGLARCRIDVVRRRQRIQHHPSHRVCRRRTTCERSPAATCSSSAYRDGSGDQARFQHPLGLTWVRERLFVADTYNHTIRTVDPATGVVATFAGRGEEGHDDRLARDTTFHEPGGVSATSKALYVADTNNHAVRVLPLDGGPTSTLDIRLT